MCYRATDQPVRAEQLRLFIEHFRDFHPRGDVHIIEQGDDHPFNRGALLNAGFDIVASRVAASSSSSSSAAAAAAVAAAAAAATSAAAAASSPAARAAAASDDDIFVFHDVDLLPDKTLLDQYASPPPVHLAAVWERYAKDPRTGKANTACVVILVVVLIIATIVITTTTRAWLLAAGSWW